MKIGNLKDELDKATLDGDVGIKRAIVAEGPDLEFHVAEISREVAAHVHRRGDEIYHIIRGRGRR